LKTGADTDFILRVLTEKYQIVLSNVISSKLDEEIFASDNCEKVLYLVKELSYEIGSNWLNPDVISEMRSIICICLFEVLSIIGEALKEMTKDNWKNIASEDYCWSDYSKGNVLIEDFIIM
jgi:hypothetical protein